MSTHEPHLARAFRETALTMLGLYRVYDVDPDLADATADALGRLFRRHLRHAPSGDDAERRCALHDLVDELDAAIEGPGC